MLVAHADWGTDPKKQWVAVARRGASGRWHADTPRRCAEEGSLRRRLHVDTDETAVLGFDFPIGLPRAFAEAAGIAEFRPFLSTVGHGGWADFLDVADDPADVSIRRPFYPNTGLPKGSKKREHLTAALGLDFEDLRRRCEQPQSDRRAATPIFWTLGGGQVGKGAISGWRLLQAEDQNDLRIWPFDGPLADLIDRGGTVAVETYPAEFYRHLGMGPVQGKRKQHVRRSCAEAMLDVAEKLDIDLAPELEDTIRSGFGPHGSGEDAFDAVTGMLGMVNVIAGRRAEGTPDDAADVVRVEGWMLGQAATADRPIDPERSKQSSLLTGPQPVVSPTAVELAIEQDAGLGPREKKAVLDLYRTLRSG